MRRPGEVIRLPVAADNAHLMSQISTRYYRGAWSGVGTAELSRTASQGNRGRSARSETGENLTNEIHLPLRARRRRKGYLRSSTVRAATQTTSCVEQAFSHLRGIACRITKVRARSVSPARPRLGRPQLLRRSSANGPIPRPPPLGRGVSPRSSPRTGPWLPDRTTRRSPCRTSPGDRETASTGLPSRSCRMARFMATDRSLRRARRQMQNEDG
jgi:hypothetical protein